MKQVASHGCGCEEKDLLSSGIATALGLSR